MPSESPDAIAIPSRSIAFVSGKGGSGKTVIASLFCGVLDHCGVPVLLIDADAGTGGLTYFMIVKIVRNVTVGLSDIIFKSSAESFASVVERAIQPMAGFHFARFLGIGDHRQLYGRRAGKLDISGKLGKAVGSIPRNEWHIIDCRGGIDAESLAVCEGVDDIVLIVEPDTTSFQATAHLVDVLSENRLSDKIRGFVINKVFIDPTYIAHNGTSTFKSRHLGSVPFDFEAMRSYLVGELPPLESPFGIHVWDAVSKLYPDIVPKAARRIWSGRDFEEVTLTNLDSYRGGLAIAGASLLLGMTWVYRLVLRYTGATAEPHPWLDLLLPPFLIVLCLFGSVESLRRLLGRSIKSYVRLVSRLLTGTRQNEKGTVAPTVLESYHVKPPIGRRRKGNDTASGPDAKSMG
jgi:septum site-determining protein MinD